MFKIAFRFLISLFIHKSLIADTKHADPLQQAQQTIIHSMHVNEMRSRVATENMANSKSAGYIPKTLDVGVSKPSAQQAQQIKVKRIRYENQKVKQVYDPAHIDADENGMVTMPDIDPLVMLMDMNQTRIDNERNMKVYQTITSQRLKNLSLAQN